MKLKTRPFDVADYLQSPEDVIEYLRQVVEDGDPNEVAEALGVLSRAKGMAQVSVDSGLYRDSAS